MEPSKRELGIRKAQADEMVISQRKLSEWRKGLSSTSQCQGEEPQRPPPQPQHRLATLFYVPKKVEGAARTGSFQKELV